jgi:phage tail sheath protein FI
LIETVEARGDALAIIDLKNDFTPEYERSDGPVFKTSVKQAIDSLKARGLNSSYACCYYPWVQIRDTVNGNLVYMPPSIAALGAMSYTDRVRAPWFAPAGFNRGGLSSGVAGLPVVNVTQKLTSKDRDKLYDANINPIATFPNEGIVIFGQKTLQVTRSALDRINVRRLLLFVKKGISTISSDILFEPNVQETWDRFINRANPFLADVKARFGLSDYKVVLDSTTTTPDLIDQNVMYAKVFLKPARAIEFIAVDFIITNTGAAFED